MSTQISIITAKTKKFSNCSVIVFCTAWVPVYSLMYSLFYACMSADVRVGFTLTLSPIVLRSFFVAAPGLI